jgi:hypothetical protein
MTSSPARPSIESALPEPTMTSFPGVPMMVPLPTIVAV